MIVINGRGGRRNAIYIFLLVWFCTIATVPNDRGKQTTVALFIEAVLNLSLPSLAAVKYLPFAFFPLLLML